MPKKKKDQTTKGSSSRKPSKRKPRDPTKKRLAKSKAEKDGRKRQSKAITKHGLHDYAHLERVDGSGNKPGHIVFTGEFLKVLDKHPQHKKIFLEYVDMYNNDLAFAGSAGEIMDMAMNDMLKLKFMEYILDADSPEAVQKMGEVNKMYRGIIDHQHKVRKDIASRNNTSTGRDRARSVLKKFGKYDDEAVEGEYEEVDEDGGE